MSIQASDAAAAAVAVAPRVSLADIEAAIAARFDTTGAKAVNFVPSTDPAKKGTAGEYLPITQLPLLSICILVMRSGYTIIGKSAPASAENFNAELGRKLAYEDAVRQLWPLMGYALRDKLAAGGAH